MTLALVVASFLLIASNYKRIERRYFFALLFFPIPPLTGILLQLAFYGTSFILSGVTVSLLIVFLNIQNRSMNIDYLTGAYNRRGLEIYMDEQIKTSSREKTFSAIWIDLDNFKSINDTYGHNVGDHVLETTVQLLKTCFRPTDFIGRFGGDEFCVVLNVSDKGNLESAVGRIKARIDGYNRQSSKPFKLACSMGYAVYDCDSHQSVEDFQKQIDELMYRDKQMKKRPEVYSATK